MVSRGCGTGVAISGETSPGRVSLACRCESCFAAAGVSASFRHCRQQNQPSHYSHRREGQEGCTVSSAYHEESAAALLSEPAIPCNGAKHTARCIVPAGAQHRQRAREWNERIQGAAATPSRTCRLHEPNFVIGDREQRTTNRQRPVQSAKGLATPAIRLPSTNKAVEW
jgi:hypothetical protein